MKLRITEKTTFKDALERIRDICNNYPADSTVYKNAKYAFGVYIANQNKKVMEGK